MKGTICLVLALAFSSAATAQDAPDDDDPRLQPLPIALKDACVIRLIDGRLVIDTTLQGVRLINKPLAVRDLPGDAELTLRPEHYSFSHSRNNDQGNNSVRVENRNGTSRIEWSGPHGSVTFRQYESGSVRLHVYDSSYSSVCDVEADDFDSLRKREPAAVMQHLGPVFRLLKVPGLTGADERLARRVLAPRRDPRQVEGEVRKLLAKLESDNFAEREVAATQLKAMGQDALIFLERLDRKALTPTALTEIEAWLSTETVVRAAEVDRLGSDPGFLSDCLYSESSEVRRLALSRLEGLARQRLELDTKADPFVNAKAIEAIRSRLVPATRPATQPAAAE